MCAVENDAITGGQEPRERGRRHPPDQLLLAPDVRDWLPEGHFAHHVSDLVDGLDPRAAPYEGDGHAPYEPRMKVLLYGYATGVLRGMARKLEEDVAFRVLGAGNFPSHRTLCEFRRRHLEEFKGLFVEVVRLARETGLLSFGKLSIDGTKVRANASKRKAMSYGRMRAEERRGGNRSAAGSQHRCGGRRALWRVAAWRRVARGIAPSRGSVGGDCCGEGALGRHRFGERPFRTAPFAPILGHDLRQSSAAQRAVALAPVQPVGLHRLHDLEGPSGKLLIVAVCGIGVLLTMVLA